LTKVRGEELFERRTRVVRDAGSASLQTTP
jgi:hypothetical protein